MAPSSGRARSGSCIAVPRSKAIACMCRPTMGASWRWISSTVRPSGSTRCQAFPANRLRPPIASTSARAIGSSIASRRRPVTWSGRGGSARTCSARRRSTISAYSSLGSTTWCAPSTAKAASRSGSTRFAAAPRRDQRSSRMSCCSPHRRRVKSTRGSPMVTRRVRCRSIPSPSCRRIWRAAARRGRGCRSSPAASRASGSCR